MWFQHLLVPILFLSQEMVSAVMNLNAVLLETLLLLSPRLPTRPLDSMLPQDVSFHISYFSYLFTFGTWTHLQLAGTPTATTTHGAPATGSTTSTTAPSPTISSAAIGDNVRLGWSAVGFFIVFAAVFVL
jgi:hypothetical protein